MNRFKSSLNRANIMRLAFLVISVIVSFVVIDSNYNKETKDFNIIRHEDTVISVNNPSFINDIKEDELTVHFIDVGGGDSIFIKYGDYDILIDGGHPYYGQYVVDYLNSIGVDDIEVMLSTHPHENHIGGLINVLNEFEVEKVIFNGMVYYDSKTFIDFMMAVDAQETYVNVDKYLTYDIAEGLRYRLIETGDDFTNPDKCSTVSELNFKDIKFLFLADIDKEIEIANLHKFEDNVTVIKIANHGSRDSTSQELLEKLNPKYGVISCGEANIFRYSIKETLSKLDKYGVRAFRTDLQSTIIAKTDGKTITFNVDPVENN